MSDLESTGTDRIDEMLRNEAVWAELPDGVEQGLLAAMAPSGPVVTATGETPSRWPVYAAAMVAVAALFAILVLGPLNGPGGDQGRAFDLLGADAAPDARGTGAVGAAEAGWWIRLEVLGLDPAPSGTYYEGWVSRGDDLVSIGTFHMRDGKTATLWSGVPMTEYPDLMVTLQTEGAGVGPSEQVVLTGTLEVPNGA
ncbi:MAG: anti-sigma factor [Acidimicrobiia bacterium]